MSWWQLAHETDSPEYVRSDTGRPVTPVLATPSPEWQRPQATAA